MNFIKKFKNYLYKDKEEKVKLYSPSDIKEEVENILIYVLDTLPSLKIYTYYENDYLTIEIRTNNNYTNYSIIKEDFEQFLNFFSKKYEIYDNSFITNYKGDNVPIKYINKLNNFNFKWIDIYINKYKKC